MRKKNSAGGEMGKRAATGEFFGGNLLAKLNFVQLGGKSTSSVGRGKEKLYRTLRAFSGVR